VSPRTASSAPFTLIPFDAGIEVPAYRQICDSLREAIVSGRVAAGAHLPGTRLLAEELGVSRNTVNGALAQLRAEGYVIARPRSGTFVNERLPDTTLPVPWRRPPAERPRAGGAPPRVAGRRARHSTRSAILARLPLAAGRSFVQPARPFQTGVPALDAFPWTLWARLLSRHTRKSGWAVSGYGSVLGFDPLREAIAAYVAAARGARCEAAQVVITSGAQQGLDLVARALVDPGDAVWLEDPGYPAARGVFAAAGARVIPVAIDGEGIRIPAGRGRSAPRLVYVTPSRQFPTGVTMSAARRFQLLRWADAVDAWIVEDDYDSEFRYASRPLSCLQGLDESGRVLYIGTFSKTVFPGLRLGYLIAPLSLVEALGEARAMADRQPPGLEQVVLAEFIAAGHLARHVRRMRGLYEERRDALLAAAATELGERVEFGDIAAGMLALAWLPHGVDDGETSRRLLAAGVEASPLSSYAIRPLPRGGLLLGYAGFPPDALRAAVRRLGAILRSRPRRTA
jgi:GntR family transcriptional regulator / MocR family aminotransferase